jgi:hypothetical protein
VDFFVAGVAFMTVVARETRNAEKVPSGNGLGPVGRA